MSDPSPPSAAPVLPSDSDAGGRPDLLSTLSPGLAAGQALVQMRLRGVEITIYAPPAELAGAPDSFSREGPKTRR